MRPRLAGILTPFVALLLACASASVARASELSDDLASRRAQLMDRLGPDAMLIAFSAPSRIYSLDVDYEYRQDSNLYYLTGMTQEETILVLMPGNQMRREVLFVKDKDLAQEHWHGRTLSHDEATARTGSHQTVTKKEFCRLLKVKKAVLASGLEPVE